MTDSILRRLPVALGAALLAHACTTDAPSAGVGATERSHRVHAATVTTEAVGRSLQAVGTVYASGQVELRPQVEGILAEALFEEGQAVSAGQALFRLDDSKPAARLALAEAQLDSARAKLAVSRKQLDRNKRLIAEDLVSRETFEELESEFLAAEATVREREASLALARRELEDYHLTAPFDGVAGLRRVDVGNYVERGTHLTTLYKTDPVEVRFAIPSVQATHVATGTHVKVVRSTGAVIDGAVDFVDPSVDPDTRMLRLKSVVANDDDRLKPGEFVHVEIVLEEPTPRLVVPEEAVVPQAGQSWVFIVDGERVERRSVELGARSPGRVAIEAGLAEGERVVVSGQHRLADGARVEVVDADAG